MSVSILDQDTFRSRWSPSEIDLVEPPSNDEIGRIIEDIRSVLDITQVDLGDMVGYSRSSISNLEQGRTKSIPWNDHESFIESVRSKDQWDDRWDYLIDEYERARHDVPTHLAIERWFQKHADDVPVYSKIYPLCGHIDEMCIVLNLL